MHRRASVSLGVVTVLALTAGACTATQAVMPTVVDIGLADIGTVQADPTVAGASAKNPVPAPELRLVLERLLGQHVVLTASVMRAGAVPSGDLDGSADRAGGQAQAAADALTENTRQLRGAVALAYGDVGGTAFANLWVQHVRSFAAYAAGRSVGDDEGQHEAEDGLGDYEQDFATFCQVATDSRVDAEQMSGLLEVHVEDLLGQTEFWAEGQQVQAIEQTQDAVTHIHTIARVLSDAIADQNAEAFPGVQDDPVTDTRSALAAALGDLVVARTELDRADLDRAELERAELERAEPAAGLQVLVQANSVAAADILATMEADLLTADLATPLEELAALVDQLGRPGSADAVSTLLAQQARAWDDGQFQLAHTLTGQAVDEVYARVGLATG